ncbi:MAG TPA: VOC family protein [Longimicrobiales bacterium]|nr:VOC family protein [Longimicrobiales bacterium]
MTNQPAESRPKRRAPEGLRGRSLAASLTVNDLRASLAWYRDVVGFTVDRLHEREGVLRAVSLKAGDVRILLGQDDGAQGWDRAKGAGFSLQITTAQSVDWIADRIKERGGTLEMEPTDTPWGARVMRLRDPDGFRLVISSEVPGRA